MNTLVETIQKIGIFLIAAQAVIHFAPGTSYAKYMKLIAGLIVLFLFLSPVYQIITGEIILWPSDMENYGIAGEQLQSQELSVKWEEMESYIENQTWKQETVFEQLEDKIKSRLNSEIDKIYVQDGTKNAGGSPKYEVTNVILKETEPVLLRIVMYRTGSFVRTDGTGQSDGEIISEGGAVNIDAVRIAGIVIGENEKNGGNGRNGESGSVEDNFKQLFADILELELDQVEVIVYGADQ